MQASKLSTCQERKNNAGGKVNVKPTFPRERCHEITSNCPIQKIQWTSETEGREFLPFICSCIERKQICGKVRKCVEKLNHHTTLGFFFAVTTA